MVDQIDQIDDKKPEGGDPPQNLVIEIDGKEKTFTVENVRDLDAQQAATTQKSQMVSEVLKAAEKYETTPKIFTEQAEAAFTALAQLEELGMIDEHGQPVKPTTSAPSTTPTETIPQTIPGEKKYDQNELKVLTQAVAALSGKMDSIETEQTRTSRNIVIKDIEVKFPNLEYEHIQQALYRASRDRSKDLYGHAEDISRKNLENVALLEEAVLKKYKIDASSINSLNEQGADGIIAGIGKGKSFSFKPGKDNKSPKQATNEHFKALFAQR